MLSDPDDWHPSMNSLEFDKIEVEKAARLEEMFFVKEVYLAILELNGDKVPGPDGFPLAFLAIFAGILLKIFSKIFLEGKIR